MALGSLLAQTFQIPQAPVAQGQPTSKAQQTGPMIGEPESALQQIDGVTGQYYQKWGDLQGFATNMWTNFGIDVTKPDFRSPEAMEAHEVYRKALADLRYQGDKLKTGQKMLETGYAASLRDPNVKKSQDFDSTSQVAGATSYEQTGMTDQESEKAILDRQTAQNEQIADRQAKQDAIRETNARNRELRGYAHDSAMVDKRAALAAEKLTTKYLDAVENRLYNVSNIKDGDASVLDALLDGSGNKMFKSIQYNATGDKLYLTTQNDKTRTIDLTSPSFPKVINELLDKTGDKITWAHLDQLIDEDTYQVPKLDAGYIETRDKLLESKKAILNTTNAKQLANDGVLRLVPTHKSTKGDSVLSDDVLNDISVSGWGGGDKVVLTFIGADNEEYEIRYDLETEKGRAQYKEFLDLNATALGLLEKEEAGTETPETPETPATPETPETPTTPETPAATPETPAATPAATPATPAATPATPTTPASGTVFIPANIVTPFGPHKDKNNPDITINNNGIKFKPSGPATALKPGKITTIAPYPALGDSSRVVIIAHDDGTRTVYGPIDKNSLTLKQGDLVDLGTSIGEAYSGQEILLQMWDGKTAVDPTPLLK